MVSFKFSQIFFILLHVLFLLSSMAVGDKEDDLLQGINSYRQSQSLPALTKNEKADCVADEIADQLEDQPCTATTSGAYITSGTQTQFTNYPKPLKKCKVDPTLEHFQKINNIAFG